MSKDDGFFDWYKAMLKFSWHATPRSPLMMEYGHEYGDELKAVIEQYNEEFDKLEPDNFRSQTKLIEKFSDKLAKLDKRWMTKLKKERGMKKLDEVV